MLQMATNIKERKKRFAVVVCDSHPKYGAEEKIGERHRALFAQGDEEWRIFACPKGDVPKVEDLDNFDGFVFTGGRFSANDDLQWIRQLEEFTKSAKAKQTQPHAPKLIGLCLGHQLFAKSLGGKVDQNPCGKFVFKIEELTTSKSLRAMDWFQGVKVSEDDHIWISKAHSECVSKLPHGAVSLAFSKSCEHEIVLFAGNIIGIQGHPNTTVERMHERVLPALERADMISVEDKAAALESMKLPHDNEAVLQAFKRFMAS